MIKIYYSSLPQKPIGEIFCEERNEEIKSSKNEEKKREKYFVWKLLLWAIKENFNLNENEVNFKRSNNGKWLCDACHFSISHSCGLVVVGISDCPIGVDAEKIKPLKNGIEKKILSSDEREIFNGLNNDEEKTDFLIETWSKKESYFKSKDEKSRSIANQTTLDKEFFSTKISVNDNDYRLTVFGGEVDEILQKTL